jgi:hypothetical protein
MTQAAQKPAITLVYTHSYWKYTMCDSYTQIL